eukprot:superscaffoldBa00000389_g4318
MRYPALEGLEICCFTVVGSCTEPERSLSSPLFHLLLTEWTVPSLPSESAPHPPVSSRLRAHRPHHRPPEYKHPCLLLLQLEPDNLLHLVPAQVTSYPSSQPPVTIPVPHPTQA